jgi:hypothetical protein
VSALGAQYPCGVSSAPAPQLSVKHRICGPLYARVPPLKYWGLRRGYLAKSGWVRSGWARAPVDAAGDPLPWYTYACIDFLDGRVRPEMRVFEYGAGQSTRWWANRVAQVDAVEDDATWIARLSARLPANVDLRFAEAEGGAYASSALERGARYDVVVIDGSDRNSCARACLSALADAGVVVWDNTEDPNAFGAGLELLRLAGFRRLDFHGLGPLNMDGWCTSIMYRPAVNCFGI